MSVDLAAGSASGEGADRLIGVESVYGSPAGDTLVGDDGANELHGWQGDDRLLGAGGGDRLTGAAGNDELDGGPGEDIAWYALAWEALAADPAAGTIVGEGTDRLTRIEALGGPSFARLFAAAAQAPPAAEPTTPTPPASHEAPRGHTEAPERVADDRSEPVEERAVSATDPLDVEALLLEEGLLLVSPRGRGWRTVVRTEPSGPTARRSSGPGKIGLLPL